mgnify:CR=1 FL=1
MHPRHRRRSFSEVSAKESGRLLLDATARNERDGAALFFKIPLGNPLRSAASLCGDGTRSLVGCGARKLPMNLVDDDVCREGLKAQRQRGVGRSRASREMSATTLTTVGYGGILQDRHAIRTLQLRDVAVATMSSVRSRSPTRNQTRTEERDRLDADGRRHVGRRRVDPYVERRLAKQGARAAC